MTDGIVRETLENVVAECDRIANPSGGAVITDVASLAVAVGALATIMLDVLCEIRR